MGRVNRGAVVRRWWRIMLLVAHREAVVMPMRPVHGWSHVWRRRASWRWRHPVGHDRVSAVLVVLMGRRCRHRNWWRHVTGRRPERGQAYGRACLHRLRLVHLVLLESLMMHLVVLRVHLKLGGWLVLLVKLLKLLILLMRLLVWGLVRRVRLVRTRGTVSVVSRHVAHVWLRCVHKRRRCRCVVPRPLAASIRNWSRGSHGRRRRIYVLRVGLSAWSLMPIGGRGGQRWRNRGLRRGRWRWLNVARRPSILLLRRRVLVHIGRVRCGRRRNDEGLPRVGHGRRRATLGRSRARGRQRRGVESRDSRSHLRIRQDGAQSKRRRWPSRGRGRGVINVHGHQVT
jgi:hypothetical protein